LGEGKEASRAHEDSLGEVHPGKSSRKDVIWREVFLD
jgi:hypothetical protein